MSKRQIKHQNAFRERQIYGKSIVTDPQLKELYEAEAKKKKGVTAYNIAVADYFNAPDIEDVDLKEYAGAAGDDNANITVNRESINRATGGGIVLGASTSLILSNLIISNNKTPFYGGGIYCKGGSPVVSNIQVTGNTATDGGGVYFKGDIRRV
ncbi:MAG: right-handed parallel beta-helix repeat-containing protein [Prevotellaceae bacterium]|nr:right-handed parallel beta-helix repeat-containing protein [Prevotellaceae bacterium]